MRHKDTGCPVYTGMGLDELHHAAEVFAEVRPRLFGIAYRMLGSASDAEDIVQDVWIKWQTYDRSKVENPAAFLATATTRLAINASTSARARRETYIGPWLPEPVDTSADPNLGAERNEALGVASLLLLEKLTPTERAAYVLREAFDYPYSRISEIIQEKEPATRQLVSRARKHLTGARHNPVSTAIQQTFLSTFLSAAKTGDLATLEKLFAEEVVSYSDGGGVVRASRIPVLGRTRVARFVKAFAPRFWVGVESSIVDINGEPSAILTRDGAVFAVVNASVSDRGIDQLHWMMNPTRFSGIALPA
jgi:RNA polymerase sigma-70 factor (TIGR02957 family)